MVNSTLRWRIILVAFYSLRNLCENTDNVRRTLLTNNKNEVKVGITPRQLRATRSSRADERDALYGEASDLRSLKLPGLLR
jgi:hypothetical protein